MSGNIFLLCLCIVFYVPHINGKQRTLKIVIPSKIRYVHHHHTHVLVMKDKKIRKEPDAKFHLHYYQPGGRKSREPYHYLVPFNPSQVDDELEDESVPEYAVTAPKRGHFHEQPIREYIPTRHPVDLNEEPEFYSSARKYRFRDRNDYSSKGYHRSFYPFKKDEYEKSVAEESELRHKIGPFYTDGEIYDNARPFYSGNRWKINTKFNY